MLRKLALIVPLAIATLIGCDGESTVQQSASDQPLLAFDEHAAVAANGEFPSADPKTVCGADDRRFLAELTMGSALAYKVPKRLADIKASPSEIMIAGVATSSSLGDGDFLFDHTFGSDFNMDVMLDAPYTHAAQGRGVAGGEMHVELSEGQLPHDLAAAGPATGQTWEAMSARSRQGIVSRFVPATSDRVLVMGHWIVDCGHTNFDTELHPLTFMARGRVENGKTVVDAFYNPYRETQLYHPDPAKALAFDDPTRLKDHDTQPFPGALIRSVFRLQDAGQAPYRSIDHLESWALLEPNHSSPVAWNVCAPAGSKGTRLEVQYHWVTRPGVQVTVTVDDKSSCAIINTNVGTATIAAPQPRVCNSPWDYLDRVAAAEAGIPGLDLQAQLGAFIQPQFKSRLDPTPLLNCYDPLMGPGIEAEPNGQRIDVNNDVLIPFYGTVTVRRAG
ncbi:MAG: hypothetical protein HY270_11640 [Deltaproteobacteria bacterium]|nr:hypothetical protein [Deltaproteobacteria bacterium]